MSARCRTTFWRRTLDHARRTGDWVLVQRLYTHGTAIQLVSDISNAHRRALRKLRIRGIAPGEVWEAYWTPATCGAEGDQHLWIRYRGLVDEVRDGMLDDGDSMVADYSVLETV